ncbi:MAG: signal peptidase I [Nitrososphaerota archaeon]
MKFIKFRALSIIFIILIILFTTLLSSSILSFFQIYFFGSGLGNSMCPTLKQGDLVLMIPYQILKIFNVKPHVNDIIVYKSPMDGKLICHRIIEINNDRIITKGDFNHAIDPYTIYEENIIAIVPQFFNIPLHIPFLGFVFYELNSNLFFKALSLFILITLEIFLTFILIKEY